MFWGHAITKAVFNMEIIGFHQVIGSERVFKLQNRDMWRIINNKNLVSLRAIFYLVSTKDNF